MRDVVVASVFIKAVRFDSRRARPKWRCGERRYAVVAGNAGGRGGGMYLIPARGRLALCGLEIQNHIYLLPLISAHLSSHSSPPLDAALADARTSNPYVDMFVTDESLLV